MKSLKRVFDSRELLWNLTLRELRTKYRRSLLGWAWSMLNPLATVAIYSFVFGVLFESNAPVGDPSGLTGFAYFLLCALLPWNFFSLITNLGMGAISANSGLVRRVAFPREVLVFSNVLHACVQFSIEMGLLAVVLLIAGSPFLPWLPVVILVSLLLAIFASGFALALSTLSVYFRDITYLWTIFLQVYFFFTPIFYDAKMLDGKAPEAVLFLLRWNPMNQFVAAFRSMLYDGSWPTLSGFIVVVIASAVSLSAGHFIFKKLNKRVAEEI